VRCDLTSREISDIDADIIGGRREQLDEQIRQRCGIAANHDRSDKEDWNKAMTFREFPTIPVLCPVLRFILCLAR
jgi:hypothetical protein